MGTEVHWKCFSRNLWGIWLRAQTFLNSGNSYLVFKENKKRPGVLAFTAQTTHPAVALNCCSPSLWLPQHRLAKIRWQIKNLPIGCMAQWNQVLTDVLYILLALPYSTCPPGKRLDLDCHLSPRVLPLEVFVWLLPCASLVPMPSARAIGVDLKGKLHSLSWPPTWHGVCEGLWVFSGAVQSSDGLTWYHLGSLVGGVVLTLWVHRVRRSGKHQLKVSLCDSCSWSFFRKWQENPMPVYCMCSYVCFLTMPLLKD